ncbi:MAG: RES family NAD+ phosphorylase, partial [Rhizobiaceae bacterium]
MHTWTLGAPLSEALVGTPYSGDVWRLVEAQHRVSTLKLVDSLDEQMLLEAMLDETKPALPPECAGLDYLLAAPFRYAPYPYGSRFRRAGKTDGVFYASEKVETAVAELAFYRLLFFAESPATPFPDQPTDFSAFSVSIKTASALDLSKPENDNPALRSLTDYAPCQALADRARAAGLEAIRAISVRDPAKGYNLVVLTPRAFASKKPKSWATWRIKVGPHGVSALCDYPAARMSFNHDTFAADP